MALYAFDGTWNTEKRTESPTEYNTNVVKFHAIYDGRPDKVLFVKGNPDSKYGDIIDAMDIARGSGILVIGVPPKDITLPVNTLLR